MLTLIGYGIPLWLFFIGLGGVTTGVLPGITVFRRTGLRMKIAGVILMLPLPLAFWWGTRETESDRVVQEMREADSLVRNTLRTTIDQLRAGPLDEEQSKPLLVAERAYVEAAGRVPYRVAQRFEELDAYERCFDRLFFCLAALMLGWAFVPPLTDANIPTAARDKA